MNISQSNQNSQSLSAALYLKLCKTKLHCFNFTFVQIL